ncbi:hypothetical protein AYI73_07100 [Shewanella algae]|nr:hypothetical protein AYI73_07100 [Shewanella algae]
MCALRWLIDLDTRRGLQQMALALYQKARTQEAFLKGRVNLCRKNDNAPTLVKESDIGDWAFCPAYAMLRSFFSAGFLAGRGR